ncbi:hypothetical protein [Nocardioides dokdonensis]|nr:hypothetical protein [Nocardioides dokdonensis]
MIGDVMKSPLLAAALSAVVLAGCGADTPAEPAPPRTADPQADGASSAERATRRDASALARLLRAHHTESQAYPRNHASLMRFAEESGFEFTDGNLIQIYQALPGKGSASSFGFCVVNPKSRAWTLYDSAEADHTTSTGGLVCQPMAGAS